MTESAGVDGSETVADAAWPQVERGLPESAVGRRCGAPTDAVEETDERIVVADAAAAEDEAEVEADGASFEQRTMMQLNLMMLMLMVQMMMILILTVLSDEDAGDGANGRIRNAVKLLQHDWHARRLDLKLVKLAQIDRNNGRAQQSDIVDRRMRVERLGLECMILNILMSQIRQDKGCQL